MHKTIRLIVSHNLRTPRTTNHIDRSECSSSMCLEFIPRTYLHQLHASVGFKYNRIIVVLDQLHLLLRIHQRVIISPSLYNLSLCKRYDRIMPIDAPVTVFQDHSAGKLFLRSFPWSYSIFRASIELNFTLTRSRSQTLVIVPSPWSFFGSVSITLPTAGYAAPFSQPASRTRCNIHLNLYFFTSITESIFQVQTPAQLTRSLSE